MNEAFNNIIAFDWSILITAGCIALLGLWCKYRLISGALFAVFCIAIGIPEIISWDIQSVIGRLPQYGAMIALYLTATCIFYLIKSLFMTVTSLIISVFLLITSFMALYGVDNSYYEVILGALWIIQLIGCLSCVLNGYRLLDGIRTVLSSIWNHVALRDHKGV